MDVLLYSLAIFSHEVASFKAIFVKNGCTFEKCNYFL